MDACFEENDMRTIETQKRIADDILHKLFPISPYAIVAGGAPRDWDMLKCAKDIDVFMYNYPNIGITDTERAMKQCGIEILSHKTGEHLPEHYKYNPNLECVYEAIHEEDTTQVIQIMKMRLPTFQSAVPYFPLSLSRVWYRHGKIHYTPEYNVSVRGKVIIKMLEVYPDDDRYILKIREKFPEYEYYGSVKAWKSLLNE
jgi:hypothetical protein